MKGGSSFVTVHYRWRGRRRVLNLGNFISCENKIVKKAYMKEKKKLNPYIPAA